MSARVFYYVQTYETAGQGIAMGHARQCLSADHAIRTAELLAARRAGAQACAIEGDPQADVWGRPRALASFGRTKPASA
jgi:hypothetical protein